MVKGYKRAHTRRIPPQGRKEFGSKSPRLSLANYTPRDFLEIRSRSGKALAANFAYILLQNKYIFAKIYTR